MANAVMSHADGHGATNASLLRDGDHYVSGRSRREIYPTGCVGLGQCSAITRVLGQREIGLVQFHGKLALECGNEVLLQERPIDTLTALSSQISDPCGEHVERPVAETLRRGANRTQHDFTIEVDIDNALIKHGVAFTSAACNTDLAAFDFKLVMSAAARSDAHFIQCSRSGVTDPSPDRLHVGCAEITPMQ